MTDIVKRLRNWEMVDIVDAHEDGALYNAAADEIERLRKALNVTVDNCRNAFDEADRLRYALTRIARGFCTAEGMKAIADEALEGK